MTSNRPKARADLALRGLVAVLATIVGLLLAACGDEGPATNAGVRIPVEWADARKVRSHETHVGKRKIECSKCHELDQGVLGPVPQERCAECHQGEAEIVHGAENARKLHGPTAGASCLDCHAFSQKPELDPKAAPGAWDCQRCHSEHPEGDVPAVVVHRSQACQTCHQPHAKPPVEQTSCPTCHSGVNATHATEGKSPEQVCTTCHASQHAPGKAANLSCAGCHAEQKPIVPATALFAEGHEKCTGCHRPHDFRPENVVSCRSCHEDRPVLGGGRIAAHAQCNSCHRPHDVKADPSGACVACHGAGKTDHPRAKGKASACTSCHDRSRQRRRCPTATLLELPHGRGWRQGIPRQDSALRGLPHTSPVWVGQGQHGHLRALPRTRGDPGGPEQRPPQVWRVPRWPSAQTLRSADLQDLPRAASGSGQSGARRLSTLSRSPQRGRTEALRQLPRQRTPERPQRTQAVLDVPRTTHGPDDPGGLRSLPPGRRKDSSRPGRWRLRQVPPRARRRRWRRSRGGIPARAGPRVRR